MNKLVLAAAALLLAASAHAMNVYDCPNFSLQLEKTNISNQPGYGMYVGTSERDQDLDMAAMEYLDLKTADTSGAPNSVYSVQGASFTGLVSIPNAAYDVTNPPARIKVVKYAGQSENGKTANCVLNKQ